MCVYTILETFTDDGSNLQFLQYWCSSCWLSHVDLAKVDTTSLDYSNSYGWSAQAVQEMPLTRFFYTTCALASHWTLIHKHSNALVYSECIMYGYAFIRRVRFERSVCNTWSYIKMQIYLEVKPSCVLIQRSLAFPTLAERELDIGQRPWAGTQASRLGRSADAWHFVTALTHGERCPGPWAPHGQVWVAQRGLCL